METSFADWVRDQIKERNWTQAELARRSGISPAHITKALNGERGFGEKSILAIAQALKLPATTAFRAAGILPEEPEYIPLLDEWNAIFYELTPDDQQEILEIARMKANKHKIPGKITSRIKKTPARTALKAG
jgi:transcriptional regulator with XRE-family HTH domain